MSKFKIAALLAASLLGMGQVQAAPATDTVQAPAGFFVPTDAQRYDVPYYRWNGEGWGWTHGLIAGAIGTATLNISAFDVDQAQGENDNVYAMDGAS